MAKLKLPNTRKLSSGTTNILREFGVLARSKKAIDKIASKDWISKQDKKRLAMLKKIRREEIRQRQQEQIQEQWRRMQSGQRKRVIYNPNQELSPQMSNHLARMREAYQNRVTRMNQTSPQAVESYRRQLLAIKKMDQDRFNLMKAHENNHKVNMNFLAVDEANNILRSNNIMKEKENSINILRNTGRGTILDAPYVFGRREEY